MKCTLAFRENERHRLQPVDNEKCDMNTALAELNLWISLIDLAKARD
jgi:hypothetical protein